MPYAEPTVQQNDLNSKTVTNPPYPSNLRHVREERAMITRAQLMTRCEQLFDADSARHAKVGKTTLHDLEAGLRRPRPNTAATLAVALETSASELFPAGFDNHVRNPTGHIEAIKPSQRTGRPRTRPKPSE